MVLAVCGGARWTVGVWYSLFMMVWYHRRVPYWSAVGRRQAGGLVLFDLFSTDKRTVEKI